MSNKALKPCPFCGGKALITRDTTFDTYWAFCNQCFGSGGKYRTQKKATAAWNRRPE
jgi:Lar family restriction alleviation protein